MCGIDGDLAPLSRMCDLAEQHGASVVVDDCHGMGVHGAGGRGTVERLGVADRIAGQTGSLSKALGCLGGFVTTGREVRDRMLVGADAVTRSTLLPAAVLAAARAALEVLERLVVPAVVLDVSALAAADPDFRLRVDDVLAWERDHGAIPPGVAVLLRTGWSARWPDRKRYFGDDTPGRTDRLHFPAFGKEATELLVGERNGVEQRELKITDFPFFADGGVQAHTASSERVNQRLSRIRHTPQPPTSGRPLACQAFIPPWSSTTSVYPSDLSASAAVALMGPVRQ